MTKLLAPFLLILMFAQLAVAQNQILTISPDSAPQGTANLTVTFTLDTDDPPAPPQEILPQSVVIGTMAGSSIAHTSQFVVTAQFTIGTNEATGAYDAVITFQTPNGPVTFSMANGFTITSGGNVGPTVTAAPQPQTVVAGRTAIFHVGAIGTPELAYQWQKDGENVGAGSADFEISNAAVDDAGDYRCIVTNDFGGDTSATAHLTVVSLQPGSTPVVDTDEETCYNNTSVIGCASEGQPFYGQDAQFVGNYSDYTVSGDGLTVFDNVTGLTWQRSPDVNRDGRILANDKLTLTEMQVYPASLNAENFGGYDDWRLPTIKELYSLILFTGTDPSGMEDNPNVIPFIDDSAFEFAYGDTTAGERLIDAQFGTSTIYVSHVSEDLLFGVNFADGRIKGYGLLIQGQDKTFFVICVRGPAAYGLNNFVDNGDSTITDLSTGLMWSQMDSREGMNWQEALAWAQEKNSENFLGHNDWRLPNVKELQTLLDYTRAPDVTNSAAIDPLFQISGITNEAGQADYPYFWSNTTHANLGPQPGGYASYVAFGRAMGYLDGSWRDVHGAGAQRSDPKDGDPDDYPFGHGPQGDAIHIFNYVRLVREIDMTPAKDERGGALPEEFRLYQNYPNPFNPSTTVEFDLAHAETVELSVYNIGGQKVATLVDGLQAAGSHSVTWNGRSSTGEAVASGIYVYTLANGPSKLSRKMLLLK
ncbi:MAG: DUF1566 domain-containing protein [Calditrichaeota bacterium]|nr:DUF1566 domain-containing protein [Calditrichota bacterium]MCB9368913.1 DUF1566 domain-containing protein [Calditrichota bacterium]